MKLKLVQRPFCELSNTSQSVDSMGLIFSLYAYFSYRHSSYSPQKKRCNQNNSRFIHAVIQNRKKSSNYWTFENVTIIRMKLKHFLLHWFIYSKYKINGIQWNNNKILRFIEFLVVHFLFWWAIALAFWYEKLVELLFLIWNLASKISTAKKRRKIWANIWYRFKVEIQTKINAFNHQLLPMLNEFLQRTFIYSSNSDHIEMHSKD